MNIDGVKYYIYEDATDIIRPWMQVAFSRLTATPDQ